MTEPRTSLRKQLIEMGHDDSGRCEKCWTVAASMYAGGQGPFESLADAYGAAMQRAEDEAREHLREGRYGRLD